MTEDEHVTSIRLKRLTSLCNNKQANQFRDFSAENKQLLSSTHLKNISKTFICIFYFQVLPDFDKATYILDDPIFRSKGLNRIKHC